MADTGTNTASTQAPDQGAGFPPFDSSTYPSQIFWLALTFGILFVVLWKVAGPRIKGVISSRRGRINDDIAAAQKARADAEGAAAAYQAALQAARARAQGLAEETRQTLNAEIAKAKAGADEQAARSVAAAHARIAATQEQARGHVLKAAEEAAIAIVARLTGENVSAADAAAAVRES